MSRDDTGAAERLCAKYDHRADALLEILHDLQAECGSVSDDAARTVAERLNLSRAEIHGVRSFYTDFRIDRPADEPVRLCRAEACQAVGSEALAKELEARGIPLETVFCLGNCALGPAALVGNRLIGRATADLVQTRHEERDHG